MRTRAKFAAWLLAALTAGFALWPLISSLEADRSSRDQLTLGIRYDRSPSGDILWLTFPPDATDADLAPFRGLRIRQLNLSGTHVTDAGLEALGDLSSLQSLNLSETPGVTRGLEVAARWTSLTEVAAADNAWIDDQQAAALVTLQDLKILNLRGTRITDTGAEIIDQLPNLQSLDLRDCAGVTDATLARIEALAQFSSLLIERSAVTWQAWSAAREGRPQLFRRTDPLQFAEFQLLREVGGTYTDFSRTLSVEGDVPAKAFESLSLFPSIPSVQIHSQSLTDDTLIPFLQNQPELTSLDVASTQITARSIAVAASECPELASLDLSGTQITGHDFGFIAALSRLSHLRMSHLDLAGADLSSAGHLTFLRSLRFDHSTLDDVALASMAALPSLETLSLDHTKVTSSGIGCVVSHPSLKYLTIEGLSLNEVVLKRLREVRPELQIFGQRATERP